MTTEREAIAGLTWTGAGKFAAQVVSWAITLVVIRLLTPEDYGLMAITSVVISLCTSVAELGLGAALVQSRDLNEDEIRKLTGFSIICSLGIGLAVAALAPLAATFAHDPRLVLIIQVAALQFLPIALSAMPEATLFRNLAFRRLAGIEFAVVAVTSVSTLALALAHFGVWSLVYGTVIGSAARLVALVVAGAPFARPLFRFDGIGRFLQFGRRYLLSRLTWQATIQSDVMIASRWLASEAIGLYSVALHLATLPMQRIMTIINQVAFPTLARMQDEPARMRSALTNATGLLLFATVPLNWGIAAIAPELTRVVLGAKWGEATFPLVVISLVIPLKMFGAVISTATTASGAAQLELRNNVLSAVIMPISFLVGVHWGVDGLAIAWATASLLMLAASLPAMVSHLGLPLGAMLEAALAPIGTGAGMLATIAVARHLLIAWSDAERLVMLILVGAITYAVISLKLQRGSLVELKRLAGVLRS